MKRLLVSMIVVVVGASAALAGPSIMRFVAVSGSSPLPEGCGAHPLDPGGELEKGSAQLDSEVEPHIATDPTDPKTMVAAWTQDRHTGGGGGRSNVIASSQDGGETWQQALVPGLSTCTGGERSRATDPWLDFGPDGVAYLASLSFELTEPTAVVVSTSPDGGQTWGTPAEVNAVTDQVYNDKPTITADPVVAGRAYTTWIKRVPFAVDAANTSYFSFTDDHGESWSEPVAMMTTGPFMMPAGGEILALPDGSLLNVFSLTNLLNASLPEDAPVIPYRIMSQHSTDGGQTWSTAIEIGGGTRTYVRDPETGRVYNFTDLASADVGPDGSAYVTWSNVDSATRHVLVARTTDGTRWSDPVAAVSTHEDPILPALAIGPSGTVAVSYYHVHTDLSSASELPTEVWMAISKDRGETWETSQISPTFDLREAPRVGSRFFLGDYMAVDAVRSGGPGTPDRFAAAFAAAPPLATQGPSDVFVAIVQTSGHDGGASRVSAVRAME